MRVLALDGGGVRGLMPSIILNYIETLSDVKISEMFDLLVGTSTGAVIACLLAAPDQDGRSKYDTETLLKIYKEDIATIFSPSTWKNLSSAYGIYGQRYSVKQRDELFHSYLKDTKLAETAVPVLITSFELNRRVPKIFKTRKAKKDEAENYKLTDVLGAAIAAPTVFSPHDIEGRKYMDALYMKNPTLAGVAEAMKHGKSSLENIHVLSLGTGYVNDDPLSLPPLSGVGYLLLSFDSTVNANTISSQYIAHQLLGDRCVRLDFGLPERHLAICDVSKENLLRLEEEAERVFWDNTETLQNMLLNIHPTAGNNFARNLETLRASRIPLPELDINGL